MKMLGRIVVALMATMILSTVACEKAPPNLTPQATVAFKGTQIIHNLDRIRDVASAAHKTSPPLIDAKTTLKVVDWHQAAIKVVHSAPAGWQKTVLVSLDELDKQLSSSERELLAPYIVVAKTVLQEVAR